MIKRLIVAFQRHMRGRRKSMEYLEFCAEYKLDPDKLTTAREYDEYLDEQKAERDLEREKWSRWNE